MASRRRKGTIGLERDDRGRFLSRGRKRKRGVKKRKYKRSQRARRRARRMGRKHGQGRKKHGRGKRSRKAALKSTIMDFITCGKK